MPLFKKIEKLNWPNRARTENTQLQRYSQMSSAWNSVLKCEMNSHNHNNLENSRKDFSLLVVIVSRCLLWRRNSQLNSVIRPRRPSGDRFPSTTWPDNMILISGLIRATLVSGIDLKVLNLGRLANNFEKSLANERKKNAIGSFLGCGIMWTWNDIAL